MIPVSVCMITKNEQAHIGACIDSLRKYPVNITVCDTGSSDDTVSIAELKADQVIHYKWTHDFSAARNASVEAAPTDYIWVMDADERVEELDFHVVTDFFINHPKDMAAVTIKSTLSDGGFAKSPVPRLFNRKEFRYAGSIHEQPRPIAEGNPGRCELLPIEILHFGYALNDDQRSLKMERNRDLIKKELEIMPDDSLLRYHLGATYYEEGNFLECERIFSLLLDKKEELGLLYKITMVMYGFSLLHLKQTDKALALADRAADFNDFADFSYFLGQANLTANQPLTALKHFLSATLMKDFRTFGTNSFLSYYHVGWIYEHMGERERAAKFYSLAGKDYPPAREALLHMDM